VDALNQPNPVASAATPARFMNARLSSIALAPKLLLQPVFIGERPAE